MPVATPAKPRPPTAARKPGTAAKAATRAAAKAATRATAKAATRATAKAAGKGSSAPPAAGTGTALATLTISSRNYSSWSLRGWLLCRFAGLEFSEVMLYRGEIGRASCRERV